MATAELSWWHVVTYAQLWRATPDAWRTAAVATRNLARCVAASGTEVSGGLRGLPSGWAGAAADAAARRMTALRDETYGHTLPLVAIDQALTEHADRVAQAKAMLAAAVAATAGTRVTVDGDGRVDVDRSGVRPDQGDVAAARRTADRIRVALALAASADAQTAHRLAGLAGWWASAGPAAGLSAQEPLGPLPSPGTEPEAVRSWWLGLTPAQQRVAVLRWPGVVGSLDGLPASIRDQANRLLLARDPAAGDDALWDWLMRPGPPRAYLLRLDHHAGRAVVALGDPDQAAHVLVHVPGTMAGLDRVGAELIRAERVVARAAELAPAESTAAVVWLDYETPDSLPQATRARYAHDAAPDLRRFVDGIREAGPAHLTVLGHSYGSLVVGAALRDHGLAADDVVFVGSAGVGVDNVAELGLPPERVWSTTAWNDPIQHAAPSFTQVLSGLAGAVAQPVLAGLAALTPDDDLWYGHNPSRPGFGGRVFGSDPDASWRAAHAAYWDPGNVALDNIARITLGVDYQPGVR